MRNQNSCCTVKHEIEKGFDKKYNVLASYTHYIFGGEVFDDKLQRRIPSNDLIIIKQQAHLKDNKKIFSNKVKDDPIEYSVKWIGKVEPLNGRVPKARSCHQARVIGSKNGNGGYLVIHGGICVNQESISDIVLFDIDRKLWSPLA
jgi:hypothetical protein